MPCTFPLQGFFSGINGQFKYCEKAQAAFRAGKSLGGQGAVSCGQCINCRLRLQRDWAIRAAHESTLWPSSSFLTFTFDTPSMKRLCPLAKWSDPFDDFTPDPVKVPLKERYSIVRQHMVKFNKDLRERLYPELVRFMYCGEYGDRYKRPHYHSIVFNYDFPDKKFYKRIGTKDYFNSDLLSSLWPHGHAVISDFSFETASYVAGYMLQKVSGRGKDRHYKGLCPEFAGYSRMPGLGYEWFHRYWRDLYPSDECVVQLGDRKCVVRPPAYYDRLLKKFHPDVFEAVSLARRKDLVDLAEDHSYERLQAIHKCTVAKINRLVKNLENE
nr:MAG: replication initiator protein [Microvirus sp.]